MKVWAGVLAAGEGRRMGRRPKALLPYGDHTFLEAIADSARRGGADGVAVVLGYHASEVEGLATRVCDLVVRNPAPERGMGSSARVLAASLPPDTAMLLWPVDMPTISVETVRAVIEAARSAPGRFVTPAAGDENTPGHPPLLPASLVAELAELGDDERLDRFIEAHGGEPLLVPAADRGVLRDVDNPEDLEAL